MGACAGSPVRPVRLARLARAGRRAGLARALLFAALLVSLGAPVLHVRSEAVGAPAVASSRAPAFHGGHPLSPTHDQTTCPQCFAIAQARTLLQASGVPTPVGPLTLLDAVVVRAPREPEARPVLDTSGPRAPPRPSLAS